MLVAVVEVEVQVVERQVLEELEVGELVELTLSVERLEQLIEAEEAEELVMQQAVQEDQV
jgi:hypothetical protein